MTTIQEIAARTGISASAAAQVLSYDPTLAIGEDIRRRVFEAASGSARSGQWPRRAPIGRIGLLGRTSRAARQADRWRSALLTGVERACRARGMECVSLVGLPDKAARPEVLDGIVAVDRLDAEELARLRARGLPAVFVGASPDDVAYDSVVIDYREAVERLIAHWRGRGFRRFAYIGACDAERDAAGQADRFYALRSGLGRHDASGLQLLRANRTEQAEEGRRLMAEALACREAPAAVVVENEELAEGAAATLRAFGLRMPEDVPLILLDDDSRPERQLRPYMAIKTPVAFMGETAVKQLADLLLAPRDVAQKTMLKAALYL